MPEMEGRPLSGRANGNEPHRSHHRAIKENAMTSRLAEMFAGLRWVFLFIAVAGFAGPSAAQSDPAAGWPNRTIRLIVPTAAGGAGDVSSRLVAQKLSERLGQQVIVENRAGASGVVGSVAIARAAPDGYTIGQVSASTHAASAALSHTLPYDAVKDFAPISLIGVLPLVIASYPGLPVKTVAELVSLAKSKPKSLSNAWAATLPYLTALLFCSEADIDLNHIPYKGSGQAAVDLVEGRIDLQFGTISPILALIRDGKLRPLAVTSAKRTPSLPGVPTVAESLLPGFDSSLWLGFAAPTGTPEPIIRRLNREIGEILRDPSMQAAFAQNGVDAEFDSPEQLGALIRRDIAKYQAVVAKAGIQLDEK
jgi:tripartite-type tricarboxylate transporter receptor subunit TctC